jgi:NhaP-type Na+/H+ or K+/H+ antiporter
MVIGSVAAGLIGAFASTYLSKKMRFLSLDKGVSETGFLFLIGFFTYIATEMLNLSGSISLLLYGIFLNHYNIYNMSE